MNNTPTVDDILKILNKGSYRVGKHEFLQDVFECGAIAVSNKFSFNETREQKYISIMGKYDKDMQMLIVEVFSNIYMLLTNQINSDIGFSDYLGEIYMKSDTSSKGAGQFFTPYHLSKLCAELSVNEQEILEKTEKDEILTMHEPTCGAGGMIIAMADILHNKYNFNYTRNFLVECGDIDARCVHMTYLQLALAGIPAVIYHRDGLSLETWDKWETPAYLMQWLRFKDVLHFVGELKN